MLARKTSHTFAFVFALAIAGLVLLRAAQAAPAESAASVPQDHGGSACIHTDPSDWTCPDSTGTLTRMSGVASASMTITYKDGKSRTLQLPEGTDAVFLSSSSVRNFLLRHYQATNLKKARAVRAYLAKHSAP